MVDTFRRLCACATIGACAVVPMMFGARVTAQQQRGPSDSDLLVSGRSFEQPQPSAYPLDVPADLGAEILPVLGNVYMIARPTGNVVVQVGRNVVEYRDMMTIIRNRVKDGVDKGLTLQQVQAMGPTLEYDPLYSTPRLTGPQLVETIYSGLKSAAPARR